MSTLPVSHITSFGKMYAPAEAMPLIAPAVQETARAYVSNPVTTERSEAPNSNIPYSVQQSILPIPYIEKYVNPQVVENALKTNPRLSHVLKDNGITPKVSSLNIGAHTKRHLFTTYMYAMEIARNVHLDANSTKLLAQASLLHDIGKALIPEGIIQKPGKLTAEEREIVNLHSELSAEILKTTDVPREVIEAVDSHHTPAENKEDDLISKILSVADVYSALKEERPYKKAMPDDKAFSIMESMKQLSQPLVKSLKVSRCNSGAYKYA